VTVGILIGSCVVPVAAFMVLVNKNNIIFSNKKVEDLRYLHKIVYNVRGIF
jgi:hypothetical protein